MAGHSSKNTDSKREKNKMRELNGKNKHHN